MVVALRAAGRRSGPLVLGDMRASTSPKAQSKSEMAGGYNRQEHKETMRLSSCLNCYCSLYCGNKDLIEHKGHSPYWEQAL